MYHHLSTNVDKYTLFIDNNSIEQSQLDKDVSSASSFPVLLDPTLDLSALLYLRATEGKIRVKSFYLENLPLSFTKSEVIEVQVTIPPSSVEVNMVNNRSATKYRNGKTLDLELDDVCRSEPQSALDYVNGILSYSVNHEIMRRLVIASLDCDIFEDDYLHTLSKEETQLLKHYLCLAVFSRQKLHGVLCKYINCASMNVSHLKLKTDKKFSYTALNESDILRNSTCLKLKADREILDFQHYLDTSLFYDIDITVDSVERKAVVDRIEATILEWITEELACTSDNKKMTTLVKSNVHLMNQAIVAYNILSVQRQQLGGKSKPAKLKPMSSLFDLDFLVLSVDESGLKCKFHLSPDLYLPDDGTTVKISFPPQMSYVLGARAPHPSSSTTSKLIVGPIARGQQFTNLPKITETILKEDQRLSASITTIPKLIYVAVSDIIASMSRDMWLQSTPFSDYNLIFCVNVDDQMISNKAIMKEGDDGAFHKIRRINNVLERFTVKLLDHNLRQLFLPVATVCRICLDIEPVLLD